MVQVVLDLSGLLQHYQNEKEGADASRIWSSW